MGHLLDHLPLKLLSLGLSAVLWFVIAGEKTSEMGLAAQVELHDFPKDLELTGEPVNAVEVRLRASPGLIQRIGPGDVSAQVDLAGVQEGEHIVHLTEDSIRLPFGVKVVKITPATLTLNLERTVQKIVPIRPRLTGRPPAGYEVAELTTEPGEVRIAGPRSRMDEVESAFTEPVSLEGAEANVVGHVNVGLEDPLLRIQGSPRVRVTARIQEVQQKRTFEDLEIQLRGINGAVRPARARVVLTGPASVLRGVAAGDVRPYVDAAQAADGASLPVAVELASGLPGVTVKESEPERVTVHLRSRRKS